MMMMMMMMTYTRDVCGGKEKTSTATCRWWERPEYDASQVECSNLDIDSQCCNISRSLKNHLIVDSTEIWTKSRVFCLWESFGAS